MTGQSRSIDAILKQRLKTIETIAQANTEQLRLNQKASGMMVLEMKDDRDGVTDSANVAARALIQDALDDNLNTINRLEQDLASLDEELASAVKKDN